METLEERVNEFAERWNRYLVKASQPLHAAHREAGLMDSWYRCFGQYNIATVKSELFDEFKTRMKPDPSKPTDRRLREYIGWVRDIADYRVTFTPWGSNALDSSTAAKETLLYLTDEFPEYANKR